MAIDWLKRTAGFMPFELYEILHNLEQDLDVNGSLTDCRCTSRVSFESFGSAADERYHRRRLIKANVHGMKDNLSAHMGEIPSYDHERRPPLLNVIQRGDGVG